MPNSCSLSAQKRDRTKSQLVKGAVKKRINPMVFKFSHFGIYPFAVLHI